MKKLLWWTIKTSSRVAFFVFMAWCFAHPGDDHWLRDIIPRWLEMAIILGLPDNERDADMTVHLLDDDEG